jgi:TP901 family phage tail tape measure protein
MITAMQLKAVVQADTAAAEKAITGFGLKIPGFLKNPLVDAGIGGAAAIAGIAIATVGMASKFQSNITTLETGAGELHKNLGMVSDGILKVAVDTGTSTKQLTDGMFMIESAGYHGKAGLDVLTAAAKGAKVGNADLGAEANAVTTIMTDYQSKHVSAANAVNFLTAVVSNGKTHLEDLAGAMSTILPTAAAVKVNLNDVGGAMATMTGEGTNAAAASTYLRQLLLALSAPAKAGAQSLKDIGLTSAQVAADMKKSLPDTLKLIMTHLAETYKVGSPEYVAALKNIAGGSKQMQGLLELTGDHLATFAGNVKTVASTVKQGGSSVVGWNQVTQDFSFKLDKAREVVETLGIRIGTALLPIAGKLVDFFSANLVPTLNNVVTFLGNAVTVIVRVGTAVGTGLRTAFGVADQVITTFRTDATAVFNAVAGVVQATISGAINWFNQWKVPILIVAGILAAVFGPTLVMMGTQAAIAGGQIAASFIAQMVASGASAVTQGARIAASFTVSMIQSGIQAVRTGASMTASLIPALIATSAQFLRTAAQGVASGTVALVQFAAKGYMAAGAMLATVVPAVVSTTVSFVTMAATAIAGAVAGFIAYIPVAFSAAAATLAVTWPVLAVIAAIAAVIAIIVLAVTHWKQITDAIGHFKDMLLIALGIIGSFVGQGLGAIGRFVSGVLGFFGSLPGKVLGFFNDLKNRALSWAGGFVSGIIGALASLPGKFLALGGQIISQLASGIVGAYGTIKNAIGNIPVIGGAVGFIGNFIPHFAAGGTMGSTGLAVVGEDEPEIVELPGGTRVTPISRLASQSRGSLPAGLSSTAGLATASAGGQPIPINIYLDGRTLAQIVVQHTPGVIRQSTGTRAF